MEVNRGENPILGWSQYGDIIYRGGNGDGNLAHEIDLWRVYETEPTDPYTMQLREIQQTRYKIAECPQLGDESELVQLAAMEILILAEMETLESIPAEVGAVDEFVQAYEAVLDDRLPEDAGVAEQLQEEIKILEEFKTVAKTLEEITHEQDKNIAPVRVFVDALLIELRAQEEAAALLNLLKPDEIHPAIIAELEKPVTESVVVDGAEVFEVAIGQVPA